MLSTARRLALTVGRTGVLRVGTFNKAIMGVGPSLPKSTSALPTPVDGTATVVRVGEYSLGYLDSHPAGGEQATVLAVHGSPGSVRDWRYLAGALPDAAPHLRLLRVDLPGFGSAPLPETPIGGKEDWSPALAALVGHLGITTPVIVLGHSSGSHVALRHAAAGRAAGLALVNPIGLTPHKGISPFWLIQAAGVPLTLPWAADVWVSWFLHPVYTWVLGFSPRTTNTDVFLSHIRTANIDFPAVARDAAVVGEAGTPSLVCWTGDDHLVEEGISTALAAALPPGPRLPFPTGGHYAQKHHATAVAEGLLALWQDRVEPSLGGDSDASSAGSASG